jgi:hypothetical protein
LRVWQAKQIYTIDCPDSEITLLLRNTIKTPSKSPGFQRTVVVTIKITARQSREYASWGMRSFLAHDCFVLDIFHRKFVQLDQLLTFRLAKQGDFDSGVTNKRFVRKSDQKR